MRMKKRPLNLLVSEELIERARKHVINLSLFFEIKLEEHLALIHGKRKNIRVYGPMGIRTPVTGSEGQ